MTSCDPLLNYAELRLFVGGVSGGWGLMRPFPVAGGGHLHTLTLWQRLS